MSVKLENRSTHHAELVSHLEDRVWNQESEPVLSCTADGCRSTIPRFATVAISVGRCSVVVDGEADVFGGEHDVIVDQVD